MKPDAPSPSLLTDFFSPLLKADRKTILWIAMIAIFVWILISDTINGGKSLLLHLSLKRQVSLGQDDAEIASRLLKVDRHNREILEHIGNLTVNRRRFEEHTGQIGDIFGRKLSLKKSAPRPDRSVLELDDQDVTVAYKATLDQILTDLPEWKALSSLPGVALRSYEIAPGGTPGKETATIVYRIAGIHPKANLPIKGGPR
jgi:hypothetical protein